MKDGKYLSWHYYPLHLTSEEIMYPMRVLADFFGSDWLPGHLRELKKWRNCVVGEHYFKGRHGSPSALVSLYELNIRLIEAVFLFNANRFHYQSLTAKVEQADSQLAAEKAKWQDYPILLSRKQQLNPLKVLKRFCKDYKLPEYREHLNGWLTEGLSVRGGAEFLETADLIQIYENLQRLYEACWMMHMRYTSPAHSQPASIETQPHAQH